MIIRHVIELVKAFQIHNLTLNTVLPRYSPLQSAHTRTSRGSCRTSGCSSDEERVEFAWEGLPSKKGWVGVASRAQ